jgi:hypothetical protein
VTQKELETTKDNLEEHKVRFFDTVPKFGQTKHFVIFFQIEVLFSLLTSFVNDEDCGLNSREDRTYFSK